MDNNINNNLNNQQGGSQINNFQFQRQNPFLNNYAPVGAQTPFYSQPILHPEGMVYIINSSQDLLTIPPQQGINLYWCDKENKVYIRNCTGGTVNVKEFFLSSIPPTSNFNSEIVEKNVPANDSTEKFVEIDKRLTKIEQQLKTKKGGEPEWQI